jgi:Lon protease-like protein
MAGPLPLFLLRTVLFPHMPLSLHVFEDRYKEMVGDCLESGTSFGVVAIREGMEAGGPAKPYRIGTLARIVHVERLDEGRMNLVVTGATRFRVKHLLEGKPYARAEIDFIPEGDREIGKARREALVRLFERYLRSLNRLEADDELNGLPEPDETIAYLVATMIETTLDSRQQLLEAPDPAERVDLEMQILRREEDLLSRQVRSTSVVPGSFSSN